MPRELESTPTEQPLANEKLKSLWISEAAWKVARERAFHNETTIKAVVEEAIHKFVGESNAA
jgi:hypothetical protein